LLSGPSGIGVALPTLRYPILSALAVGGPAGAKMTGGFEGMADRITIRFGFVRFY